MIMIQNAQQLCSKEATYRTYVKHCEKDMNENVEGKV
jgi:hypothetical protein